MSGPARKSKRARRLRRVGVLGGSFNPAHEGHLYISRLALKNLGLDEIWWMVSPQNPLKSPRGMAPFAQRMKSARAMARDPRVKVTGIEQRLGTRYTADSLRALKSRFPRLKFVWLMGADNLSEIPRWEEWTAIFEAVPIAVFNRPTYSLRALSGKAAQRFARYRLRLRQAKSLAGSKPPAWIFFDARPHPASATSIRQARGAGIKQAQSAGSTKAQKTAKVGIKKKAKARVTKAKPKIGKAKSLARKTRANKVSKSRKTKVKKFKSAKRTATKISRAIKINKKTRIKKSKRRK